MKRKLVLPILMSFLITSIPNIALANTAPKCPTSVTKYVKVRTPLDKNNSELKMYLKKILQNSVRSVSPTSRKVSGKWWTKGIHECRFPGVEVASGYRGFLPDQNSVGFQTAITLNKETLSGGNNLFISYYKKNSKWVIAEAGSGP